MNWEPIKGAARGVGNGIAAGWDSLSPEARSLVTGLGIGFALGALAVGMLL